MIPTRTLYPATFGLLTWLTDTRKNPAVTGGETSLTAVGELCWAFTLPAREVCSMPPKQADKAIQDFMADLTPEVFLEIQGHAQRELEKFTESATKPKKPKARQPRRPTRKK
jgi:hypothetical protein